jgi:hypothetical protein
MESGDFVESVSESAAEGRGAAGKGGVSGVGAGGAGADGSRGGVQGVGGFRSAAGGRAARREGPRVQSRKSQIDLDRYRRRPTAREMTGECGWVGG